MLTLAPVYAPRIVSKSLPLVVNTRVPVSVATHLYQIDAAGAYPPWLGSPVSRVAVSVEFEVLPVESLIAVAPENGSLINALTVVTGELCDDHEPVPTSLVAETLKM